MFENTIKFIVKKTKEAMVKYSRSNSSSFKKNIKLWFCLFLVGTGISFFIVWQPFYFLLFLGIVIFLAIVFWKTEECFLFLLFYLPFQLALNITKNIDLASGRIFILALFLVWLVKSLASKKIIIPYKITTWLLLFFFGLALLSVYFSINQEKSAIRLLFFASIFPLYFISSSYFCSIKRITKGIYVLLFSSVLVAIVGITQFFSQFIFGIDAIMNFWEKNIAYLFYGHSFSKIIISSPSWLVNIGGKTFFRAISFFPDPHMFAFYLGMVIPVALSMVLFSNIFNFSSFQKLLLYFCNLVLFLALGFTFSRAGYVGAFFGISSLFFLSWKFLDKKIKFVVIGVVLISSFIVFSPTSSFGGLVTTRFFSSFNLSEGSNAQRLLKWKEGVDVIEKYPISGVGIGAYAEALNARAPQRSSATAHNTYLDVAAEMGILAMLVWIIILVVSIKKFLSVLYSKGIKMSKEKVISLGLASVFIWFSAQMFFDTAIYSPTLLSVLMVYLAISVNLEKRIKIY